MIDELTKLDNDDMQIKIKSNKQFFMHYPKFKNAKKTIEYFGNNGIKEISNVKFEKYRFKNLNLKVCKIRNASFKYSYIYDYSYLRHTEFIGVDFTGTVFENVNLEKADFKNCTLDYVRFENCIVDYKNILKNKSEKPNLSMILIMSLYKNELQQGNIGNADDLFLKYKEQERKLYKYMLASECKLYDKYIFCTKYKLDVKDTQYYNNEMDRRGLNISKILYKLIISHLNNCIWGYGINILRIFRFMIINILVFAVFYCFKLDKNFNESIILSAQCWVINNETDKNACVNLLMILENLLGLISLAMFTSALYRRIEK
jgi:hypothetical protein